LNSVEDAQLLLEYWLVVASVLFSEVLQVLEKYEKNDLMSRRDMIPTKN